MKERLCLKEIKRVIRQSLPRASLVALFLASASCAPSIGRWSATYCSQPDCPNGSKEEAFKGFFPISDKELTCPAIYKDRQTFIIGFNGANGIPFYRYEDRVWYLKPDTCQFILDPQSK